MAGKAKDKAKEADKKPEAAVDAKKAVKKKSGGAKGQIFMIAGITMAAVFLASSTLLVIGMMPTFAAFLANPRHGATKAVTVGAINLAGCVPFLLELWTHGNSLDMALKIVTDPKAIVVMYAAAAIGYMIDWSMSMIIASVLYQRGIARQKAIENRQEELVTRWGEEVTGRLALDQFGFPIDGQKTG